MAGNILTAAEVPEENKRRSVAKGGAATRARRGRKKVISQEKACKILHDKPDLTKKARGFMAARCEGRPVKRK